jgi:hypothetical protein
MASSEFLFAQDECIPPAEITPPALGEYLPSRVDSISFLAWLFYLKEQQSL